MQVKCLCPAKASLDWYLYHYERWVANQSLVVDDGDRGHGQLTKPKLQRSGLMEMAGKIQI